MVISKAQHKVFLYKLFLNENGVEKSIPLSNLMDASSVLKKLKEGGKEENGVLEFANGDIDFTIDEAKLLKDHFNSLTSALPSQVEIMDELKKLLI